jgi:hypothetical protein
MLPPTAIVCERFFQIKITVEGTLHLILGVAPTRAVERMSPDAGGASFDGFEIPFHHLPAPVDFVLCEMSLNFCNARAALAVSRLGLQVGFDEPLSLGNLNIVHIKTSFCRGFAQDDLVLMICRALRRTAAQQNQFIS